MSLSYDHLCTISKELINWFLIVGKEYGTLNQQEAIRLSKIKPSVFKQWVHGKKAAPAIAIERIKLAAVDNMRCLPRGISNKSGCYKTFLIDCSDPKLIARHYEFKKQLLKYAKPITKRRMFKHLKLVHRYKF